MKNVFVLVYLSLAVLSSGCAFGQALSTYKWTATIKVVGENADPIAGADVSVQYTILPPPPPGQQMYGEIKGFTDNNGVFVASRTDSSWTFGVTVRKAGYYNTHINHDLYQPGQLDDKTVAASR